MATKGKFSGHHCFWTNGTMHEIEKDRVVWLGEFNGPFVNSENKGFLHGSAWRCPGINDMVEGRTVEAHGYCVITDTEGDEAYLRWRANEASKPGELVGKSWFTGGTGKYEGVTGENDWNIGNQIKSNRPDEPGFIGLSNFSGEYEIPGGDD